MYSNWANVQEVQLMSEGISGNAAGAPDDLAVTSISTIDVVEQLDIGCCMVFCL